MEKKELCHTSWSKWTMDSYIFWNRSFFLVFALLLFTGLSLKGQESVITIDQIHEIEELGLDFHNWGILKDQHDHLWIASDNGLYRFDGSEVEYIGFRFVKDIIESSDGSLFVLADEGLFEILPDVFTWEIDTLLTSKTDFYEDHLYFPKTIFQDQYGVVWIGENNNVAKYKDGKIRRYKTPKENAKGFLGKTFFFAEDGWNRLWSVSYEGQLHYYNILKDKFIEVALPFQIGEVASIVSFGDDRIWIGTGTGVIECLINESAEILSMQRIADIPKVSKIKLVGNTTLVGTWESGIYQMNNSGFYTKIDAFRYSDIVDFISDEKSIWVATHTDVLVINKLPFSIDSLSYNKLIASIKLVKDNSVVISEGWTVYLSQPNYKGDSRKLIFDSKKDFWINNAVMDKDFLWMATSEGIYKYSLSGNILEKVLVIEPGNWINDFFQDSKKDIWISFRLNAGVIQFNQEGKVQTYSELQMCQFVREDNEGLIVAGGNAGLLLRQMSTEKFERIPLTFDIAEAPDIMDAAFWKDTIYMATRQGLYMVNKNHLGQPEVRAKLLIAGSSHSVVVDHDGAVWFATPAGLSRYWNHEFTILDRSNGLPSREIIANGLLVDYNNVVWCATSKGIGKLTDRDLLTQTSFKPKISELKRGDQTITVSDAYLGSFFSNSLVEMNFTSLAFPSSKVQYKMTLKRGNEVIKEEVSDGTVSYFSLAPDDYSLDIRAKLSGRDWSEPVSYTFDVKIPWYRTVWFNILAFFTLTGLILYLFRLYNRQLRHSKSELEALVKERTAEILQQENELIRKQKEIISQQNELIEKNKTISETQSALNTSEIQFLELKKNQMQRELEYKSKQLTSLTLNIVGKNQNLLDICASLDQLANGIHDTQEMSKDIKKFSRQIRSLLKQDDRWEAFRIYFEQVHTDFYSKLKISHPNLTSNDLKQCALVKLNLSLDESAALSGVSPESVRMSRYRIQKKMGLSTQNAFTEYMIKA